MSTYSNENLYDEFIEAGIVGTILKKPEMSYYADMVTPTMFHKKEYQGLFWALKELTSLGIEKIDEFTIINKLHENKVVYGIYEDYIENRTFGDLVHKLKLVGTDDVLEFRRRLEKLITLDFRRTIPNRLELIADSIRNNTNSVVNELNSNMHSEIMKVSSNYLSTKELRTLKEVIREKLFEIKNRANHDGHAGLPSKYKIVNNFLTYEDGELILIAGRRKEGKSVILMNEAWHKASQGVGVLILDTELPTRQWIERLLAHITGLTVAKIKSGSYNQEEEIVVEEAVTAIEECNLAHIYLPELFPDYTFEDLFMITKTYQQTMGNLGLVVMDYIKANRVSGIDIQEHNYLGDMTEYLKNSIAGRLKIPVLASAQMSDKEDRIANSAKISQYASCIIYWMKKTVEEVVSAGKEAGTHKLVIKFNRLGRQFEDDEHINMVADLDIMQIQQAKIQDNINGVKPYE